MKMFDNYYKLRYYIRVLYEQKLHNFAIFIVYSV